MRREWRFVLIAVSALVLGAVGAESYARLATPYYLTVARWIARGHLWDVVEMGVGPSRSGPGTLLRLTGTVRARPEDSRPSGRFIAKLQVAAVVESPAIFWTILLAWPISSFRKRLALLAIGVPIFLGLEAVTTVCQLLNPLAYGSAVLAGDPDPVTLWEHWSRFLEAGGRVALACCASLCAIALVEKAWPRARSAQR